MRGNLWQYATLAACEVEGGVSSPTDVGRGKNPLFCFPETDAPSVTARGQLKLCSAGRAVPTATASSSGCGGESGNK